MKHVPASPEWYADNELNVSLWGTYAFTGTEYDPNLNLIDFIPGVGGDPVDRGTFDRYLGGDHAWGGGVDIKYFFYRYFGVGIEGFLLDAKRNSFEIEQATITFNPVTGDISSAVFGEKITDRRIVGSVLGTFTLRYPIGRTPFSPYGWAGVGAIFGGGERETVTVVSSGTVGFTDFFNTRTNHFDSKTEVMGQFGGGLEFRFTRHIGWTNDFSWNVINGAQNNFGMFRTGLNFAF
jgi:hypothetical protein